MLFAGFYAYQKELHIAEAMEIIVPRARPKAPASMVMEEVNPKRKLNIDENEEEFFKPNELTTDVIKYIEQFRLGKNVNKERDALLNFANCKGRKIHQKPVKGHRGCVNALGIGRDETLLASSGDDKRVLLWKINDLLMEEKPRPVKTMDGRHFSNVFATSFSSSGDRLISTGNDSNILVHDIETGQTITRYDVYHYPLGGAVYSATFVPNDENVFIICSENPEIEVFDVRVPGEHIQSWQFTPENYSVDFHPNGRFFAIGGKRTLAVVDFRNGKDIYKDNLSQFISPWGATHAKWNPDGRGIAAVRSCTIPIYLDFADNSVTYLSDNTTYFTRNTVKACEFIDNNSIVTGSEHFEIFMWHLDQAKVFSLEDGGIGSLSRELKRYETPPCRFATKVADSYIKLLGHRSIPNGMKYSPKNGVLFSSGVEKTIRMWSLTPFVGSVTKPELRKIGERHTSREPDSQSFDPESEDEEVLQHFDRFIRISRRNTFFAGDSDSSDDPVAFDPELDLTDSSDSNDEPMADDDVEAIAQIMNEHQDMLDVLAELNSDMDSDSD